MKVSESGEFFVLFTVNAVYTYKKACDDSKSSYSHISYTEMGEEFPTPFSLERGNWFISLRKSIIQSLQHQGMHEETVKLYSQFEVEKYRKAFANICSEAVAKGWECQFQFAQSELCVKLAVLQLRSKEA